jgi:ribosomal protein S18 acetylase RimI-like enzyme
VRRLDAADAPAWRALRLRGLREHPEAFTSSYEEDCEQPLAQASQRLQGGTQGKFWGALDGEVLAGIVGLERERRAKNRHKATVVGLYVAPEFTRRGIGTALMRALLDDARESGIALLVLTVTASNRDAEVLYERHGFKRFGTEPGAIRVGPKAFDKHHLYLQLETP